MNILEAINFDRFSSVISDYRFPPTANYLKKNADIIIIMSAAVLILAIIMDYFQTRSTEDGGNLNSKEKLE